MLRRLLPGLIGLLLLISLVPIIASSHNRPLKVIYYWNLESPPEGLEVAIRILDELKPDMIWYAHWVTGFPMPRDSKQAYEIARSCGLSEDKARRFSS